MKWLARGILMSEFERADRQLNVGFRRRSIEVIIISFYLTNVITCRHLGLIKIQ